MSLEWGGFALELWWFIGRTETTPGSNGLIDWPTRKCLISCSERWLNDRRLASFLFSPGIISHAARDLQDKEDIIIVCLSWAGLSSQFLESRIALRRKQTQHTKRHSSAKPIDSLLACREKCSHACFLAHGFWSECLNLLFAQKDNGTKPFWPGCDSPLCLLPWLCVLWSSFIGLRLYVFSALCPWLTSQEATAWPVVHSSFKAYKITGHKFGAKWSQFEETQDAYKRASANDLLFEARPCVACLHGPFACCNRKHPRQIRRWEDEEPESDTFQALFLHASSCIAFNSRCSPSWTTVSVFQNNEA